MPTIKDVAKRAGVGVGTASRVIAGNGPVSEDAAKRVRKAIDELKFRPSHAARVLQKGQSQTIGVFVPLIQGSFYTPILHAVYTALRAAGRHMVVDFGQTLESERQDALAGAEFLTDRGCDGLIMMGTALQPKDVEKLTSLQPRLVLLNRSIPHFLDHCFNPDHKAAGAAAAHALFEAGHRHLAVVEGPKTSSDNTLRMRGFFDELAKLGLDTTDIPRVRGDFSPDSGWSGARALLAGGPDFTALFCANDEMALGALSYLRQEGVSVPRDMSVMGYDGIDLSAFTVPSLTTVLIPWREIATNALNYLLNLCYDTNLPVRRDLPAKVLWRGSVAATDGASTQD
ncbi:MAG: LacI family DNA-binding transcriptional regulator [Alphaproteobacteria bacterium]|nr:LacI family transcriptional regulator [Alphaproteobacteria bacterium]MDE2111396.1 LacI family DNA-binding transcriptional regulator [Alphaproteobacteria bacterium]MDE2495551.1 LacI family DNA-binding transcriptional regulator [Alphaproteobacteria bacterium]